MAGPFAAAAPRIGRAAFRSADAAAITRRPPAGNWITVPPGLSPANIAIPSSLRITSSFRDHPARRAGDMPGRATYSRRIDSWAHPGPWPLWTRPQGTVYLRAFKLGFKETGARMVAAVQTLLVVMAGAVLLAIPITFLRRPSRKASSKPALPGPLPEASERIARLEASLAAERARYAALAENHELLKRLCAAYLGIIEARDPGLLGPQPATLLPADDVPPGMRKAG